MPVLDSKFTVRLHPFPTIKVTGAEISRDGASISSLTSLCWHKATKHIRMLCMQQGRRLMPVLVALRWARLPAKCRPARYNGLHLVQRLLYAHALD